MSSAVGADARVSLAALRAAHVVHHYGKLSESFIPDALQELERAGAEAWVVTLSVDGRETYPFPPDERLLVCPEPSAARRALDRVRGRSGAERFAAAAAERLRPLGAGVVHAQFGWAALSGVRLARHLGLPSLVSFHGTDVTTATAEDYREPFRDLDVAIAVSEFIQAKLRELGFEGRIEIVPAGVDLSRLQYRGAEPPGPGLRLLYVGRLNAQKGVSVLLHAMPAVVAAAPQVSLELIGGGPDEESLRALASELALDSHVTFHGPLPAREDVLEGLRRAHVLVMPSRAMPDGAAEGSPVVTKEAQAVGVPLVSTATGGIAETLPPEHRDALVPGNDPDALAGAIVRLLESSELRAERSARGREWVEEQFEVGELARRTVALYEELVTRPDG